MNLVIPNGQYLDAITDINIIYTNPTRGTRCELCATGNPPISARFFSNIKKGVILGNSM
jgi:hypothetical protein